MSSKPLGQLVIGIKGAGEAGAIPVGPLFAQALDDALADLNSVVTPVLAVMDGTVGLEGNGPKSGWPRLADRLRVTVGTPDENDSFLAALSEIHR